MWIESKPDGKFKCVERYTDPMTDKVKRVSVTIDKNTPQSRKAAQKILNEKIEKATVYKPDDDITLGELIKRYLTFQKGSMKPQTYDIYKTYLDLVARVIPEDAIVRKMTVRYIYDCMESTGKSVTTMNLYLTELKQLLRWGYQNDYLSDSKLIDKLKLFSDTEKKSRIEDKYLSSDELTLLINNINNEKWILLIKFLALSGLRIGEAIALKDSDVTNVIHVDKTYALRINQVSHGAKSDSGNRDVFIQPDLEKVIQKIRTYVKRTKLKYGFRSDLFLPDTDGRYIKYDSFKKFFRTNTKKYIGRPLTPHALRHTHVSLLAENGVPLEVISRRVGHESSDITKQIYLHITDRQKEKDNQLMAQIHIL